jgi:hypothetical protein
MKAVIYISTPVAIYKTVVAESEEPRKHGFKGSSCAELRAEGKEISDGALPKQTLVYIHMYIKR